MLFPFFNPLYLLFALPGLLLGFYAQARVKSAFAKYERVRSATGMTGAQAARRILDANGLHNVGVERVNGFLSDHYDPGHKVLRLSPQVYDTPSLAAVGVAAHEAGHALQDKEHYPALKLRSALVPSVQIGGWVGPLIFFVGLSLNTTLAWILAPQEIQGVNAVLDAAALTYVAAAIQAIMTLAYYAYILLGRRRE